MYNPLIKEALPNFLAIGLQHSRPDKVTSTALPFSSPQIGSLTFIMAIVIVCYFPPKLCERSQLLFHLSSYKMQQECVVG